MLQHLFYLDFSAQPNTLLRSTVSRVAAPATCAGAGRDGQRPVLRAGHLSGLDQTVEDGPPRALVGQLTGRHSENLELRLALAEAGLPVHLGLDLRLGLGEAGPGFRGRDDDDAVVVADHEVARLHPDAAEHAWRVDRAPLFRGGAAGGVAAGEDREVGPARQDADVAHGAVDDEAGDALAPGVPAQD